MSVFNRNEKEAGNNIPGGEKPRDAAPVTVAPVKPVQASVQPMGGTAEAPKSIGVSVISKALRITGQLESTEDIRIDGEVDGDIHGVSVTVGPGAKVKGSVYGPSVELV